MDTRSNDSSVRLQAPDGATIPGIVTLPGPSPRAHAVLLHGITTHKNEFGEFFARVAERLADSGVASLRIDFRGHGDSTESWRQFTVASQVLDALTCIKWWQSEHAAANVHFVACSFGAPAALYASLLRRELVKTVSLVCPVLDYRATFLEPSTDWAAGIFNQEALRGAFDNGFLQMNESFRIDPKLLIEMETLKPFEALRDTAVPTLIIHGESDSMVPCRLSRRYASGLQHVRLVTIPRMDHGFTDEDDEEGYSEASERNIDRIVHETLTQMSGGAGEHR